MKLFKLRTISIRVAIIALNKYIHQHKDHSCINWMHSADWLNHPHLVKITELALGRQRFRP